MLLKLDAVTRTFGGVHAAEEVSFAVAAGEVRGLIGPNGAGKTTLLNLISGLLPLSAGAIRLNDTRIDRLAPHRIAKAGITRTFQNIRLFGDLSAQDNVLVGEHVLRPASWWQRMLCLPGAGTEARVAREHALELLVRVGLGEKATEKAANLSYGEQRRVEIARALASHPRVLLLDEPTAGMSASESTAIATLIRTVVDHGHSVLLVEHNVPLVMNVCDRITVLNFGRVIAEGSPAEVARDQAVIDAYLGGEP